MSPHTGKAPQPRGAGWAAGGEGGRTGLRTANDAKGEPQQAAREPGGGRGKAGEWRRHGRGNSQGGGAAGGGGRGRRSVGMAGGRLGGVEGGEETLEGGTASAGVHSHASGPRTHLQSCMLATSWVVGFLVAGLILSSL